ncbi:unnamed protein product [Polarella glacialis]|uniref:MYND-type domain-containing protein n=1 Tax=Polarella glacialis TaxID=89957 RepID=A0A813HGA8_POLGL|nr:unnamed protein product [Polarella glacialis]
MEDVGGLLPSLLGAERMQVIQEVFSETRQLDVLIRKLGPDLGPKATLMIAILLQNLACGSCKVHKALLRPELLLFIWSLVPIHEKENAEDIMTRGFTVPGLMLNFVCLLLDHHPAKLGKAVIDGDPEAVFRALAATLHGAWEAIVHPGSSCWAALVLVVRMTQELAGPAQAQVSWLNRKYIWPVMQSFLFADHVPPHWLQKGWGLGGRDKQIIAFNSHDAPSALRSIDSVETALRDVNFICRLLHDATVFVALGVIDRTDIHADLASHVARRYCSPESPYDSSKDAAIEFVHCIWSKASRLQHKQCSDVYANQRQANMAKAHEAYVYQFSKCSSTNCTAMESAGCKFRVCRDCKLERYCSRECQVRAWKHHKRVCSRGASHDCRVAVT